MRAALVFLAAALVLLPFLPQAGGTGQPEELITGPGGLGPGSKAAYNVTIRGFEDNLSAIYRIEAWLEGANLAGGSPTNRNLPFATSSRSNQLQVNVTAPTKEQQITLHVRGVVELPSSNFTLTNFIPIQVLSPWTITVPIRNGAAAEVVNATARFFLDDRPIGNITVPRIPADGVTNVSLTFVPVGVGAGAHTLRVDIDFNGDGRIDPALGEGSMSAVVYREAPPVPPAYIALGVVSGVVLGLAILVVMRRRRA